MSFTCGFSRAGTLALLSSPATLTAASAYAARPSSAACGAYARQGLVHRAGHEEIRMLPSRRHGPWALFSIAATAPQTGARNACDAANDGIRAGAARERPRASLHERKTARDGLRAVRDRCGRRCPTQYQINRCTTEHHPTGRFDYRFQHHYNWCRIHGARRGRSLQRGRRPRDSSSLQVSARQRNAQERFTPSQEAQGKADSRPESAPDDESSEEPLQVSEAVDPSKPTRRTRRSGS